jgi:hypothetical protein
MIYIQLPFAPTRDEKSFNCGKGSWLWLLAGNGAGVLNGIQKVYILYIASLIITNKYNKWTTLIWKVCGCQVLSTFQGKTMIHPNE